MDRLLEVAARQHSLIGREQALAYGMTVRQIESRIESGRLEIMARGVYRIPGSVATWEQRVMAQVLATGPFAAASPRSAAALWRLPGFRPGPVEVTQGRGPSSRNPCAGLHDSRFLPPHQVRTVEGIPTVRPERTLLDLCGCVHPRRAERALDNALAMDFTTVQQLGLMLAETGRRGRTGAALLRRILATRTTDNVPRRASWRASSSPSSKPVRWSRPTGRSGSEGPRRPWVGSTSSTARPAWSSRRTVAVTTRPGSTSKPTTAAIYS